MSNRHARRPRIRALRTVLTGLVLVIAAPGGLAADRALAAPADVASATSAGAGAGASTFSRDITLTGSLGTTRTFHATVTRSATTLAGYASKPNGNAFVAGALASGRFDTFTGIYYYANDQPIWTYTTDACLSLNLIEWKECMSFRIYYVRNHTTGQGIVIWGANYTFAGLRGARHCHAPGSGTTLARYENLACGEHRYDPDKTHMKQWDQFQMTYNPGPQEVYAFHVNEYANGTLTGPYSGLGV
jgi:hypothetical protein